MRYQRIQRTPFCLLIVGTALLLGLGGGCAPPPAADSPESEPPQDDASEPSTGNPAKPANERDAPEISRSVGEPDGVVVLWPRVVPRSDDAAIGALAAELQKRLAHAALAAAPARKRDVRPEPERVCPRSGCAGPSVGAVLVHAKGGCVAVALVTPPGASASRILPWAGLVKIKNAQVPFREPPESQLTVRDAVPCGDLVAALDKANADLVKALDAELE